MDFFKHQIISVDKIIPFAMNSRTHDDAQVTQLAASIREFGFTNPLLIDPDMNVIAGHGRLMAAKKLNMTEVPAVIVTGLDDRKRRALVIADNKLALNAGWDDEILKNELSDLAGDFGELMGFSQDELVAMLQPEQVDGITDEDEVPEPPPEPVTKLGDIWILGNHRLMCGDSTSIDAVEKLVDNVKIDLCYTDPPYGINESGNRVGRGNLGNADSKIMAKGVVYKDFKDDSIDYAIEAYQIVESVLQIPRQVWWGANYYCHALPQSNNWFVWDKRTEDKYKNTNSDAEMAWVKSQWSSVRVFRHLWMGLVKGSEHGQARVHPTQKPVALAEWSFDYFKTVKTVLDLFGGSGSTLIACEKTNRQCYMMEFEPHYCDVIVKRWENFTGKKATHADTGETFNG